MGVSGGNRAENLCSKVIPLCIFYMINFLRFLHFYEVPGLYYRDGWNAPGYAKGLFIGSAVCFTAGIWISGHYIFKFLLLIAALAGVLYCEWLYMAEADFTLSDTVYALWIYAAAVMGLMLYCAYTFWRNIRMHD